MKRSYRQNCALAYGLDIVGERWTLLIVRELLIADKRYGELIENLPGIGTNLLADRLKEMEERGLVSRVGARYRLTDLGRGLEPVVHAIVRFGLMLNKPDDSSWLTRPEWDVVALRALYDAGLGGGIEGTHVIELNKSAFLIEKAGDEVRISPGDDDAAATRVSLSKATARRLGTGKLRLADAIRSGRVVIRGARRDARRLLAAFGLDRT